jgi:hypothetical protein
MVVAVGAAVRSWKQRCLLAGLLRRLTRTKGWPILADFAMEAPSNGGDLCDSRGVPDRLFV